MAAAQSYIQFHAQNIFCSNRGNCVDAPETDRRDFSDAVGRVRLAKLPLLNFYPVVEVEIKDRGAGKTFFPIEFYEAFTSRASKTIVPMVTL